MQTYCITNTRKIALKTASTLLMVPSQALINTTECRAQEITLVNCSVWTDVMREELTWQLWTATWSWSVTANLVERWTRCPSCTTDDPWHSHISSQDAADNITFHLLTYILVSITNSWLLQSCCPAGSWHTGRLVVVHWTAPLNQSINQSKDLFKWPK